jgi:hypothetical protein
MRSLWVQALQDPLCDIVINRKRLSVGIIEGLKDDGALKVNMWILRGQYVSGVGCF